MVEAFNNAQARFRRILELVYLDQTALIFRIRNLDQTFIVRPDGFVREVIGGVSQADNQSSRWVESILAGSIRNEAGEHSESASVECPTMGLTFAPPARRWH